MPRTAAFRGTNEGMPHSDGLECPSGNEPGLRQYYLIASKELQKEQRILGGYLAPVTYSMPY